MIKKEKYKEVSPDIQRSIVAEYLYGVRGCCKKALAKNYKLSRSPVRNILARAHQHHGDPVQPRYHNKPKLILIDQRKLFATLDQNPSATIRDLAAAVNHKITTQRVSDYLALAEPRFKTHTPVNQEPEELTAEWKNEMSSLIGKAKKIRLDKIIYGDEAAVYSNEVPKGIRTRCGKRVYRLKPRWGKRYTLHVYARRSSAVH